MQFWKQKIQKHSVYAVLLQETHTDTAKAKRLKDYWHRIWGKTGSDQCYSYWSTGTGRHGVGILLNPYLCPTATPHNPLHWNARQIAVSTNEYTLISLYAPNNSSTQAVFFQQLPS